MKSKTFVLILGILLLLVNNCAGYKPIFKSNLNFKISDYSIEGEKILANKIYSQLYNLSKSSTENSNTQNLAVLIKTTKEKKGGIISKENFINISNLSLFEKTKNKKNENKKEVKK